MPIHACVLQLLISPKVRKTLYLHLQVQVKLPEQIPGTDAEQDTSTSNHTDRGWQIPVR